MIRLMIASALLLPSAAFAASNLSCTPANKSWCNEANCKKVVEKYGGDGWTAGASAGYGSCHSNLGAAATEEALKNVRRKKQAVKK